MKKLFSYLIGLGNKAPPPSQKRAIPAHEVALKQASVRRRDEKPKVPAIGEGVAESELPSGTARAEQADDGAVRPGGGEMQPPLPQKLRKRRKARREVAGGAVEAGARKMNHQLADIAMGVGRAKRKSKGVPADGDAGAGPKKRRRRPE